MVHEQKIGKSSKKRLESWAAAAAYYSFFADGGNKLAKKDFCNLPWGLIYKDIQTLSRRRVDFWTLVLQGYLTHKAIKMAPWLPPKNSKEFLIKKNKILLDLKNDLYTK